MSLDDADFRMIDLNLNCLIDGQVKTNELLEKISEALWAIANRLDKSTSLAPLEPDLLDKLNMPLGELRLPLRPHNALADRRILLIADLLPLQEEDLLAIRHFGRTSLHKVKRKLAEMGLQLGSKLPRGFTPDYSAFGGAR